MTMGNRPVSRAAADEARAMFALVRSGRETAEAMRATIGLTDRDLTWLGWFAEAFPDEAAYIGEAIEFRKQVLAEFDRLVAPAGLDEAAPVSRATPNSPPTEVGQAPGDGLRLEAEEAWVRALTAAEQDRGGFLGLAAQTQEAIRAAGGLYWIGSCPKTALREARARFIDEYMRCSRLGSLDLAISPHAGT
jgi:hypothetical protein